MLPVSEDKTFSNQHNLHIMTQHIRLESTHETPELSVSSIWTDLLVFTLDIFQQMDTRMKERPSAAGSTLRTAPAP